MGAIRFWLPEFASMTADQLQRTYIVSSEGIPWQGQCRLEGDQLVLYRTVTESGMLCIPWNVTGIGELMLTSGHLRESDSEYLLPIELARGTLHRIRTHLDFWTSGGLRVEERLKGEVREATRLFARSVLGTGERERRAREAQQALQIAAEVMNGLASQFSEQILTARPRDGRAAKFFGCNLGSRGVGRTIRQEILRMFNGVAISPNWRTLETEEDTFAWESLDRQVRWAHKHRLRICLGPLLRFDSNHIPNWLYLWEDNYEALQTCVAKYVTHVVRRYQGMAHLWHVSAGINLPGSLNLREEGMLRLTAAAVDAVRKLDTRTPVIVSFDQPWADYLARQPRDLSPLHCADALLRADLGITGLGLELNFGYWPGGTPFRDPLELSFHLDRWSLLGAPLVLWISAPSSRDPDSLAWRCRTPIPAVDHAEAGDGTEWMRRMLPFCLAKKNVQGVIWSQLCDASPRAFAHAGLFNAQYAAKPAVDVIKEVGRRYLKRRG